MQSVCDKDKHNILNTTTFASDEKHMQTIQIILQSHIESGNTDTVICMTYVVTCETLFCNANLVHSYCRFHRIT